MHHTQDAPKGKITPFDYKFLNIQYNFQNAERLKLNQEGYLEYFS